MGHEQNTFTQVIHARSAVMQASPGGDVNVLGNTESALRKSLGGLFALAEQYPDLKANLSFEQLSARISGLEDAIADRREFYNESVNIYNIRIEQFPDLFIARLLNFQKQFLLQFQESEMTNPDLKTLFNS